MGEGQQGEGQARGSRGSGRDAGLPSLRDRALATYIFGERRKVWDIQAARIWVIFTALYGTFTYFEIQKF